MTRVSFDLGDPVPLSVTISDASRNLADAGNVALTITLPDGTTVVQDPVVPASVGVYDYIYETVQAGVHRVRWLATGVNASAYTEVFDVEPAEGAPFVSLADTKRHLNKYTDEDDEPLRGFISAACQMITDRMGAVSPETVIADRAVCSSTIVLPRRPVISITSVARLPGGDVVPAADALAGTPGWSLESSEGVLKVSGSRDVRVTYRAGRSPLPPNFRLAALELVAHLWRGSQHNQAGGRPTLGDSDAIAAGLGRSYAMPYRVMELLGMRKDQERDEPLIA